MGSISLNDEAKRKLESIRHHGQSRGGVVEDLIDKMNKYEACKRAALKGASAGDIMECMISDDFSQIIDAPLEPAIKAPVEAPAKPPAESKSKGGKNATKD